MKRILFAIALVMLVSSASAMNLSAPAEVAANTAFSILVEFDALDTFNEAIVQVNDNTIVSLETVSSNKIYVKSVDKSVVLNLTENTLIESNTIYLLVSGFSAEGENTVKVEEIGKGQKSVQIDVFIPASKDFEEQYSAQFNSLKETIMSYANDIDDLKAKVVDLESALAAKATSAELQDKIDGINSTLDNIQGEVKTSADATDLELSALEQTVNEQGGKLAAMEEETEEFTSTGFISFKAIQNETALATIGALIVIAAIAIMIAKGKISLPKMPKLKKKEKTIYSPSDQDAEITSSVLEDSSTSKDEPQSQGKWAFGGGSWKPKPEPERKKFNVGDLLKKD